MHFSEGTICWVVFFLGNSMTREVI